MPEVHGGPVIRGAKEGPRGRAPPVERPPPVRDALRENVGDARKDPRRGGLWVDQRRA